MPQILSIQYLRAFAAIAVLLYHAVERADLPGGFAVGAAGVDVFFVISGFIMWTVTERRPCGPGAFLKNRVIRIVPLYWIVTLGVAAAAAMVPALFPNMRPEPGHVAMSLLFVPHAAPDGNPWPLIVPGWTLNYEMFFYAVFALGLLLQTRLRLLFMSAALGGLVLLGLLWRPECVPGRTYTDPLLLEFLAGIWLACAFSAGKLPGRGVGWTLVVLGVAGYAALQAAGFYDDRWRALIWGVPAFCIVCGAVSIERAGRAPEIPLLRLLGDASYSVYLLHTLAIAAVAKLVGSPWLLILGGTAFGILAGIVSYQLLEKPSLALLKGLGSRRSGPTVGERSRVW